MPGAVTTYAQALRIVQDLALQNQIDERDIGPGDDRLAALASLQDAALTTVQAYLDRAGPDALPAPADPSPTRGPAAPEAMGDPDPSDLADAVRVVLDMGRGNVLDDDGPDMADEVARQERAVALVEYLVANHGSELAAAAGPGLR